MWLEDHECTLQPSLALHLNLNCCWKLFIAQQICFSNVMLMSLWQRYWLFIIWIVRMSIEKHETIATGWIFACMCTEFDIIRNKMMSRNFRESSAKVQIIFILMLISFLQKCWLFMVRNVRMSIEKHLIIAAGWMVASLWTKFNRIRIKRTGTGPYIFVFWWEIIILNFSAFNLTTINKVNLF